MKTKQTLLVAGGVSAMVLLAPLAKAGTSTLDRDRRGRRRAHPAGPPLRRPRGCDAGRDRRAHRDHPRRGSPRERGLTFFELTRLTMFFAPFTVERTCSGISGRVVFSEIGVSLASAVFFTANSDDRFTIPKEKFLIYESVIENGLPQTRYKRPIEDVTGTIDLARGTVHFHVAVASRLRFRAGCDPVRCTIDEELDGTQTAEIFGTNAFPDADGDGVKDPSDNCPLAPNPNQAPVATPVIIPPPDLTLQSCLDHRIGVARANRHLQCPSGRRSRTTLPSGSRSGRTW